MTDPHPHSLSRFRTRHAALVVSVAALAVAGCGSSSSTKTKAPAASTPAASTPSTPSTPSTTGTSTPAVGGAYSTKVQAALAPVQAEFKAVQANPQTAKQGSTWTTIAATIKTARDRITALTPPSGAATIQSKLVSLLGAMSTDAGKVGTDLDKQDKTAAQSDLNAFRLDALKLQTFGQQLLAR